MIKDYFKIIDTQNKAYFLGLLQADGSVTSRFRGNYEEIRLQLSLQVKDIELLYKFCEEIGLSKERVKIYKSARQNESDSAKMYIAMKEFTKEIVNIKDASILSKIPDNLMRHFIRGIFDGDGCIYGRGTKYYSVNFAALDWVSEFLISELPYLKSYPDKRTPGLSTVTTNKQSDLVNIYNYLYTDSEIYLTRKYDKFNQAFHFASTTRANARRNKRSEIRSTV